jgi:VWFA-related protein
MRQTASRLVIPILLAALPAFAATADKPPQLQPLTEKIDVSLINVDVTVNDRFGHPVAGLTQDDFEILEDGQSQTIKGFYAIEKDLARQTDAAVSPEAARFRRKVLLLIDNNTLPKAERNATLAALDKFLDKHFESDYEWSVVSVGPRAETIQSFTSDKAKIHAAIDTLRHERSYDNFSQGDRSILSDPIRGQLLQTDESPNTYDFGSTIRFLSRDQTLRTLQATIDTARSVIHACRAYSSSAGKKIVLLVTGGIELNSSFSVYDSSTDRNMQEMRRDMERVLEAMVVEANAANFNLYVMDGRAHSQVAPQHDVTNRSLGLGSNRNMYQEGTAQKMSDTTDTDSGAMKLALNTGGQYLPSSRVDKSLEKLDNQSANYYSLAYTPAHTGDGQYHHIKVHVKRHGTTAQYREGYVDLSNDQRFEQMLRAPITFPKTQGTLPVAIQVGGPAEAAAVKKIVPVTATLPTSKLTLFPHDDRFIGRVHIYLTVYDKSGSNVGYSHQIQDVSLSAQEMKDIKSLKYQMTVALVSGDFTVVVTLRDDISNDVGTAAQLVKL